MTAGIDEMIEGDWGFRGSILSFADPYLMDLAFHRRYTGPFPRILDADQYFGLWGLDLGFAVVVGPQLVCHLVRNGDFEVQVLLRVVRMVA